MSHLNKRISALVDGELGHEARDRALAHVAHCRSCRDVLAAERALKDRVSTAASPVVPERLVQTLLTIGQAPEQTAVPARRRRAAALMPALPQERRSGWLQRPPRRTDARRPRGARTAKRARYAAASVFSVAAVVLGTAFAAGGAAPAGVAVVPPAAEFSVEHAATTAQLPLADPAFDAVSASFGGLSLAPATAAVPSR